MLKDSVMIVYRNHRGQLSEREVLPHSIEFIETEWHPEQWILQAYDYSKGADRSFAMSDIIEWRDIREV